MVFIVDDKIGQGVGTGMVGEDAALGQQNANGQNEYLALVGVETLQLVYGKKGILMVAGGFEYFVLANVADPIVTVKQKVAVGVNYTACDDSSGHNAKVSLELYDSVASVVSISVFFI